MFFREPRREFEQVREAGDCVQHDLIHLFLLHAVQQRLHDRVDPIHEDEARDRWHGFATAIIAVFVLLCSVPAEARDSRFASPERVMKWVHDYRKNPQPMLLP